LYDDGLMLHMFPVFLSLFFRTYQLLIPCALFPFSCLWSYNAGKIQPLESLLNYSIKLSVLIYKKYVYRSRGMFGCNVILHGFVANWEQYMKGSTELFFCFCFGSCAGNILSLFRWKVNWLEK
jgi:hypothetical protein